MDFCKYFIGILFVFLALTQSEISMANANETTTDQTDKASIFTAPMKCRPGYIRINKICRPRKSK